MISITFDVETVSEANQREHWSKRNRRHRIQKQATIAALLAKGIRGQDLLRQHGALSVTLTRQGARQLDDDNLRGAFKAIRDQVATWLGCDDGPKGPVAWAYAQEQRRGPLSRVRIEIAPRAAAEVRA